MTENEKTLDASSCFCSPKRMEILTDAPVAIILDSASIIMITGMTRFTAARASSPR